MFSGQATGATLRVSDFNSGDDGWKVGNLFGNSSVQAPEYVTVGGYDGGYIQTQDLFGYNAFGAPASWLGDQSGTYGATLHFHQRVLASDGNKASAVVITDGTTRLQFRATPPGTSWTEVKVWFHVDAGWQIANGSGNAGPAATEAQLRTVLSNLTGLAINADWLTGSDLVGLDSVSLSMPEPASVGLSAFALVAFAVLQKRRRRSS